MGIYARRLTGDLGPVVYDLMSDGVEPRRRSGGRNLLDIATFAPWVALHASPSAIADALRGRITPNVDHVADGATWGLTLDLVGDLAEASAAGRARRDRGPQLNQSEQPYRRLGVALVGDVGEE